jgi:hypothetical protein
MSTSSLNQKLPRGEKKTSAKRGNFIHLPDVVASVSLFALSTTVLALVFESMVP